MFNWFKNKHNSLIPADIDSGLMSSFFTTIKLGEKVTIPPSCVCFVSYKDKVYNTLEIGTHTLNKELLIDLYQKQLKKQEKLKKLKVDFFYVNMNEFNFNFEYIDKVPLNGKLSKLVFSVDLNINVENCTKFSNWVLSYYAGVTAESSKKLVLAYVEEIIRSFFLKKSLTGLSISSEVVDTIKDKLSKYLNKVGISLNGLKIKIFGNENNVRTKAFMFEDITEENNFHVKEDKNSIDQTKKLYYNESNQVETKLDPSVCPHCKCKKISGSIYCHRCGKPLN